MHPVASERSSCESRPPVTPTRFSALSVALVGLVGEGCFVGHSSAHYQCRSVCTSNHDACIVSAADAPTLQRCDSELSPCLASCPY